MFLNEVLMKRNLNFDMDINIKYRAIKKQVESLFFREFRSFRVSFKLSVMISQVGKNGSELSRVRGRIH